MKINKMPVTLVLLNLSWSFLVLGILIPGYLFIQAPKDTGQLIVNFCLFFAGLLLSAVTRMLANIGQMVFDIRLDIQRTRELSNNCLQNLFAANQNLNGLDERIKIEFKNQTTEQKNAINILNRDLVAELQRQNSERDMIINRLSQALNSGISGINAVIKTELLSQTSDIEKIIKALDQSLIQSQNIRVEAVKGGLTEQTAQLNKIITELNHKLISELKSLSVSLQMLASSSEQINCDSKDLNQNISQIKIFFEQIEKHLDLKQ